MPDPAPYGYTRLPQRRTGLLVCALLAVASCASCATVVAGPAEPQAAAASSPRSVASGSDREAEAAILSKINTTIGQAACETDAQCRTLGLGANACGGPAAWRPWSTLTNGQADRLRSLADELSALQRRRQMQDGRVSTCRYIPNPGAQCQDQLCVLKKISDPEN